MPGSSIEAVVRPLAEDDATAWQAFISSRDDAVFYHTLAWRDFVKTVFGHQPYYLLCEQAGRITGILPLFLVRFPLLGSKLISLPYDIGAGGPLAVDAQASSQLARHAMTLARQLQAGYLQFRCAATNAALAQLDLDESQPVILSEIVLDNEKDVWSRIEKDHRKAIRKAQNRGVVTREAVSLNDYLGFFDVYLRVFRAFGTPPYGRDYFEHMWHDLAGAGYARLILAEVEGRCIGGLLMFAFGRNLTSKFAAVLPEGVPMRAYPALYWRAMEIGLQENYARLSWGTSSRDQAGLIEFKERWGATSNATAFYDLAINGSPPDIGKYYDSEGLSRQMWKRLPLAITPVLGRWLNRWFC
jgi:FemAB-related protein (PEP-CTERM system-associated)